MPSSATTHGRNCARSASRLTYGSPVSATRPIIPSPTTKRALRMRSETPMRVHDVEVAAGGLLAGEQDLRRAAEVARPARRSRGRRRRARASAPSSCTARLSISSSRARRSSRCEQLGAVERDRRRGWRTRSALRRSSSLNAAADSASTPSMRPSGAWTGHRRAATRTRTTPRSAAPARAAAGPRAAGAAPSAPGQRVDVVHQQRRAALDRRLGDARRARGRTGG